MIEQYYTVKEVADILKIEPALVRVYIRADRLKAAKVGKYYRIPESALKELLRIREPMDGKI